MNAETITPIKKDDILPWNTSFAAQVIERLDDCNLIEGEFSVKYQLHGCPIQYAEIFPCEDSLYCFVEKNMDRFSFCKIIVI